MYYHIENQSICVGSYTHPDYPILDYSINITINSTHKLCASVSDVTECIHIPNECLMDYSICGPFQVTVTSRNVFGSSRENIQFINGIKTIALKTIALIGYFFLRL